ncbi:MAG: hypothetical protein R2853_03035 [Thermomicrobiales bacterium]
MGTTWAIAEPELDGSFRNEVHVAPLKVRLTVEISGNHITMTWLTALVLRSTGAALGGPLLPLLLDRRQGVAYLLARQLGLGIEETPLL